MKTPKSRMKWIKACWSKLLNMKDDGKLGKLYLPGQPKDVWFKPCDRMPNRHDKVEVITYENEIKTGTFYCDNNWHVKGHDYDLFNDQIIKWRHIFEESKA